ncbi:MAG: hypothetical protein AMS23_10405 [Bacteroides sp. SM1_62]|nr:MAG: hypothetical protein AMS26_24150 [Bacteroides sp. SM23_62]KPL20771.1 MAG: hypothetical protein AMS23_10405 [Bacteroides sp. SM1_62]
MIQKTIFFLLLYAVISSCHSRKGKLAQADLDVIDSLELAANLQVSEEAIDEIIQSVSSPVEMAALIKEIGTPFSMDYLATTDYVDRYNTSSQMAFSLGIFGADLGYLNIYKNNVQIVDYLMAINQLANGIRVGHFFDFVRLNQLATSREGIDSLMYISVSSFNNIDSYLRENNRGHLSALMITGVWIECLYLATRVASETSNPLLNERIGEQKLNLHNLLLILNPYKDQKPIADLLTQLDEVKEVFDQVEITYEIGVPETVEKNGMVMILQNEKSIVKLTDEQLQKIINKTEEVRNKLIAI